MTPNQTSPRAGAKATIVFIAGLVVLTTGAAGAAVPQAAVTTARNGRLERLLQLDDEQWRTVELLMALSPEEWETVQAVVRPGANPPPGWEPIAVAPPQTLGLADIVNTILARVNAIRSTADSLAARTPDRPDVRGLVGQVDLGPLRDMLAEVRDTLQGLIDVARDLREGYDSFDVVQFRARLGAVFTDLESASSLYQRLLCIDDPDIPIRQLSAAPLKRLIDHAPGVVLYAMSKVLDAIDPTWDQRIGSVVGAVPAEAAGLCNDGAQPAAVTRVDAQNIVCKALRPKHVGTALALVKVKLAEALLVFRWAKNHTKDEIQATAGAEVVAGATAGTSVKNPAHEAAEQWVDRLENIKDAIEKIGDRRKDCLDADKDIETDLRDCAKDGCLCAVPLSVLLQGATPPTYTYVADLLRVRIDQAEDAGLANVGSARDKLAEAIDATHDETAAGYGLLCQAYRLLLPDTGVTPIPPDQTPRSLGKAGRGMGATPNR